MYLKTNQFFRRLKRLIEFIPTIWNTWDFDYSATITLMSYQLERTAKRLETGYGDDGKYHAGRIRTAIKLLEYSNNYHYHNIADEDLQKIYGTCTIDWEPVDGGYYYAGLRWEKATSLEHNQQIEELYRDVMREADRKEQRAHELAWRIISENIKYWWD